MSQIIKDITITEIKKINGYSWIEIHYTWDNFYGKMTIPFSTYQDSKNEFSIGRLCEIKWNSNPSGKLDITITPK